LTTELQKALDILVRNLAGIVEALRVVQASTREESVSQKR
jgi:hypothetical protein